MAKKKAANADKSQAELADWGDKVPEEVQKAADAYEKALAKKNKAQGDMNTAKENCIELMREHGVSRVRVRNGAKVLKLDDAFKLKVQKPEKADED